LDHFAIEKVNLLTNNKHKYQALDKYVADVTPLSIKANQYNRKYLEDKQKEQAHVVDTPSPSTVQNEVAVKKEIPISLPTPTNLHKLRVSIIRTAWNEQLVNSLADQTIQRLLDAGVKPDNVLESVVPGAFELPWAAQQVILSSHPDVVICFGVLIKGETAHFEYISSSVSQGLMDLQIATSSSSTCSLSVLEAQC
jgi:6,7-dimethyl-8-ribityllumazine synthase